MGIGERAKCSARTRSISFRSLTRTFRFVTSPACLLALSPSPLLWLPPIFLHAIISISCYTFCDVGFHPFTRTLLSEIGVFKRSTRIHLSFEPQPLYHCMCGPCISTNSWCFWALGYSSKLMVSASPIPLARSHPWQLNSLPRPLESFVDIFG